MRWPRPRFRLRTLLLGLTFAAVVMGQATRPARLQRAAVLHVERLGGYTLYDYELLGESRPPGWSWRARWLGRDFAAPVGRVYLSGKHVTDDSLRPLHSLAALQEVVLETTSVTDAGAAALQRALPRCVIRR